MLLKRISVEIAKSYVREASYDRLNQFFFDCGNSIIDYSNSKSSRLSVSLSIFADGVEPSLLRKSAKSFVREASYDF